MLKRDVKNNSFFTSFRFYSGIGKKIQNKETEPSKALGLLGTPEGVQRYGERRSLRLVESDFPRLIPKGII